MIDLDARRAEIAADPKEIRLGGQTFNLPAELPGDVIGPFLSPDLGLVEVIADAIGSADDEAGISDMLFAALGKHPALPTGVVTAAKEALVALLGDQHADFLAKRPSVPEYLLIAKGLFEEYGLTLNDFFGSPSSSDDEETNSKQTSPSDAPESTPTSATSGDAPATPDSSDSAG